ncbi:AAA family ATPase [Amycolatopsis sp. AA4]|uniref:ATP-binding protein n=1 Tax=Amycolatopsis sp. AA4 TaxID=1896961 RepID=UPI000C22099E|nr:AAA family ATPase [Amycolatopsis sp. AA4]ATY09819.1 AAA family ATPase [Amycolatopsis sp. AA4]
MTWETANGRFLAASLEWLREVLRNPGEAVPADAVEEAEAMNPPPALTVLARRLGLSRFEQDTLLLCAAAELDPSIAGLCAEAHGNAHMPYPTFGLALRVLPDPAWEAVSPQGGLRYWQLIEGLSGQGVVSAPLRAAERAVNYLKGLNSLDDRLAPLVTPLPLVELSASQQRVAEEVASQWALAGPVQLTGADEAAKRQVTAHAAELAGLVAYRLPAAALPAQPVEADLLARVWQREAALLPLALYLEADETDGASEFLDRIAGPAVLAVREGKPGRRSIEVSPPTPAERALAWREALGSEPAAVEVLAAQFALDLPSIAAVAAVAGADPEKVWQECRVRTRPRLDGRAQRLESTASWDDLVLPEQSRRLLGEIADQVGQRTTVHETWGFGDRGRGLSVLFTGPSGTGKTMAAAVLANRLALDLYRIDLSTVVSKYIGETEKNLRNLFDAAEGAILFFDEAESLFGKRGEVRDAHDRYATIEVDYLLQRMEAHRGLAILATNMRSTLDTAFLRRLRFVVEFAFPGLAERKLMWEKAFPTRAPCADLDCDRLAQLQTSGAMIRNIALNAAFLAAAAGEPITMETVLAAARTEFRKLELPVPERDFQR